MKRRVFFLLLIATWAALGAGCGRSTAIPAMASGQFGGRFRGAATVLAPQIEAAIKPLIAEQTKIVRADSNPDIMFRCSARGDEGTIRLVEIRLVPVNDMDATDVTVSSSGFAFFGKPRVEETDLALPAKIGSLIEKTLRRQMMPGPSTSGPGGLKGP